MQYKILLAVNSDNVVYYKYYQVSPSEGDWSSTDKAEAIAKITELLQTYSISEISVVVNLDITTTIDIPELANVAISTSEN